MIISVLLWVIVVLGGGMPFLVHLTTEARKVLDGPQRPIRRVAGIVVSGTGIYFDACRSWRPDVAARLVLACCALSVMTGRRSYDPLHAVRPLQVVDAGQPQPFNNRRFDFCNRGMQWDTTP